MGWREKQESGEGAMARHQEQCVQWAPLTGTGGPHQGPVLVLTSLHPSLLTNTCPSGGVTVPGGFKVGPGA